MDCTTKVSALEKVVSGLELKLDDLENRSRRSNLIVYGIPEDEKEDEESLEQVINNTVAKGVLKIEPVSIERIHRLGKPSANKTRPIIFKLLDDRDKTKILKNCHKLKDTDISISEDFFQRVRNIRKKLWDSAKPNKESGQKVHLVYDKISIDRILYRWDDTVNDKVMIGEAKNPSTGKKKPAKRRVGVSHSKPPQLRFINVNCRSVLNKLESLECLLLDLEPDFVALTETWLNNDILDSEVTPPNYNIIRKDRPTRGGGVALMIKREIQYTVLPEVEGVEAVFLKLKFSLHTTIVGCCYRSPTSGEDSMQSLYNYIEQNIQSARFILLGDFNLPDIDWQSMKFHSACSDVVIDTMLRFNLHQVVNQPTRVQGETSNILDLIFLSNHFPADETKIEVMDGISDHKLTLCTVPFRDKIEPTNIKITYPDFKYADDNSILNYLIIKFPSFEELSNDSSTTIEILWSQLKEIMHHCIPLYLYNRYLCTY